MAPHLDDDKGKQCADVVRDTIRKNRRVSHGAAAHRRDGARTLSRSEHRAHCNVGRGFSPVACPYVGRGFSPGMTRVVTCVSDRRG